jgi:hypothetical protein
VRRRKRAATDAAELPRGAADCGKVSRGRSNYAHDAIVCRAGSELGRLPGAAATAAAAAAPHSPLVRLRPSGGRPQRWQERLCDGAALTRSRAKSHIETEAAARRRQSCTTESPRAPFVFVCLGLGEPAGPFRRAIFAAAASGISYWPSTKMNCARVSTEANSNERANKRDNTAYRLAEFRSDAAMVVFV